MSNSRTEQIRRDIYKLVIKEHPDPIFFHITMTAAIYITKEGNIPDLSDQKIVEQTAAAVNSFIDLLKCISRGKLDQQLLELTKVKFQ